MKASDVVVAIFADHHEAGSAIGQLIEVGFETGSISIVGRGFDRPERPLHPSRRTASVPDRDHRGAFWSEMWSSFQGGHFVSAPSSDLIVALGHLATHAANGAGSADRSTARLRAALAGIGIPVDHVIRYEFAVHANGFLVMAHGDGIDIARARTALRLADPASIDVHAVGIASPSMPLAATHRVFSEAPARTRLVRTVPA